MRAFMSHDSAKKKNISAKKNIHYPPGAGWLPEVSRRRNHEDRENDKAADPDIEEA